MGILPRLPEPGHSQEGMAREKSMHFGPDSGQASGRKDIVSKFRGHPIEHAGCLLAICSQPASKQQASFERKKEKKRDMLKCITPKHPSTGKVPVMHIRSHQYHNTLDPPLSLDMILLILPLSLSIYSAANSPSFSHVP